MYYKIEKGNRTFKSILLHYRERITDSSIGKLLAKYAINMSENKGYANEIYDLIEKINSESIKSAFKMQISKNLGFTRRGAFEVEILKDIERHILKASLNKLKLLIPTFP
ncbi:hypothetical protein [Flavobacterium sp. XS2P39]|uniref:hypothetical protein n=1 Tax=Flavobacterium sp. XS2P39 TaxID=3401725 RepID=UPI003AAA98FB